MTQSNSKKPIVVVGDGWAALTAVGLLTSQQKQIHWIAGSASRIFSPLPSLEAGPDSTAVEGASTQTDILAPISAQDTLLELTRRLGIELGEEHSGNFQREFKNKAFREPTWTQAEGFAERAQGREESLWDPERSIAHCFETRFDRTLAEIEEEIRLRLASPEFSNLRRIEGNPLSEIRAESGTVQSVVLASGEEIECESVIFADRWSGLGKIKGLPKSLGFARQRDPYGLLQTTFTHSAPIGVGVMEGFYGVMNRESGEEFDRHVWGYFSSDGLKSQWTVCFSSDESEDNHEIAKKLRRMKQTLEKMFTGSEWLPQPGFMSNVCDEQVRFEESFIFGAGKRPENALRIPGLSGISFMTDGYGPSCAFQQAGALLNANLATPIASSPKSESQDVTDSASL